MKYIIRERGKEMAKKAKIENEKSYLDVKIAINKYLLFKKLLDNLGNDKDKFIYNLNDIIYYCYSLNLILEKLKAEDRLIIEEKFIKNPEISLECLKNNSNFTNIRDFNKKFSEILNEIIEYLEVLGVNIDICVIKHQFKFEQ